MEPTARWIFPFLYKRRGMTNQWELQRLSSPRRPSDGEWKGPGARRERDPEDPRETKVEWIEVGLEDPEQLGDEELLPEAEDLADSYFQFIHKGAIID